MQYSQGHPMSISGPRDKGSITEKNHLSGALEQPLGGLRVDLIVLNEADPFVAAEVIRGERVFIGNNRRADEYEPYGPRRAGDVSPPWKGSEWHGAGKGSMAPIAISKRVVVDLLEHVDSPLREIRPLPIENQRGFFADRRNIWAAESCLRRSLEALFDIGRHVLAKGFGSGVSESKEIAVRLQEKAVFSEAEANLLMVLAGYRNRLVHFYHEVFAEELFEICVNQLGDMGLIQNDYRRRMKEHSEKLDSQL
jgi:uncharacterized protein YutE (UPF0331/DUF86 family)